MSFVFQILHAVPYSNKPIVKDVIARLHSYVTSNLLIAFAVIISFKQFGGRPIECMLPIGFSGAWEQYAENFCWAQDTYFVPTQKFVEQVTMKERRERRISYYQWMPFFLLFQAACFKIPALIWKYFAGQSGMKMGEILRLSCDPANSNIDVKKANIKALCIHLQGALRFHQRLKKKKLVPHKIFRILNIKYSNYYITIVYIASKSVFLLNNLLQMKLMSRYLLPPTVHYNSIEIFKALIWPKDENSTSWHNTGIFPRVTICDFDVREMGNVQTHTVQCMLIVNLLTEKIFVLLLAWFAVLAAITVCSLINWIYLLVEKCSKEHFLLNHLEMSETPFDKSNAQNKEHVDRFLHKYLGTDGIFVLRSIAAHADVVFATELIASLWRSYYVFEERRRSIVQIDKVWPQHQQRLEHALIEEEEVAKKISEEAVSELIRKRSMYRNVPFFGRWSSSMSQMHQKASSDAVDYLCEQSGIFEHAIPLSSPCSIFFNEPRGSLISVGSQNKLKRRRSLENIEIGGPYGPKKFVDSSDEDDDSKEKSSKMSKQASRKSSVKFH